MINGLVRKGWSKNEIVAEVQRVWGQDVLILPHMLDDERTFALKYGPKLFMFTVLFTPFALRMMRSSGYKQVQR